jgi:enoyl-CoA hydratase/carnithine racemase
MAEYETILTGVEDGIGTITLNRPDVRNSLSSQVLKDLRAALDDFREDDGVGVVAFTGAG